MTDPARRRTPATGRNRRALKTTRFTRHLHPSSTRRFAIKQPEACRAIDQVAELTNDAGVLGAGEPLQLLAGFAVQHPAAIRSPGEQLLLRQLVETRGDGRPVRA